ncbi:DUF1996 domain-containing protein [Streptacidiphilus sp. ASG 303]|uniref:DUF1996 domain-containing protein n=1 Tax=Streptacidiphilus sp. ASG 303 TaxID=2896847 RepID=UPI001E564AF1|nr:DUF1996 domain-containing protein [Streptacidiphilus sp. ASG 303]MCD0483359.1 DUF1996 domain-containing protein [Streptacidiphilus sp. ASG 303]
MFGTSDPQTPAPRSAHRFRRTRRTWTALAVGLAVAGGGLAVVNQTALAHTWRYGSGTPVAAASPAPSATGVQNQSSQVGQGGQAQGGQAPNGQAQNGQNGQNGGGAQNASPLSRRDFTDITRVGPNVREPRTRRGGSRGVFFSRCGVSDHNNPDNFIVAPGVSNGAHHMHDYVGNKTSDGFSNDQTLAAAGTTCVRNDRSAYFWPVLRLRNNVQEADANAPGGGQDQNVGQILKPAAVSLQFRGNPVAKVVPMPRFMRVITGDAKAVTNGTANARAQWTCSGFTDRRLSDTYPVCPGGRRTIRVLDFPSCWDGKNTDSANHRTHVVFPDPRTGRCAAGLKPVPQLRMVLSYNVPRGQVFALDTFPEQLHKAVTDHGDFVNVMSDRLMRAVVGCINANHRCA